MTPPPPTLCYGGRNTPFVGFGQDQSFGLILVRAFSKVAFFLFCKNKAQLSEKNCACIKACTPRACWPSALSSFLSTNTQQRKPVQLQAAQEILIPALQKEEVGRTYNRLIRAAGIWAYTRL